ncbi:LysR substrate-binding domain-containing protein [Lysobacter yangpyeongensis]|uniref:LysR substrate-binding domain-containing protein n=1 Tax=Lysobacter yangpyeongensis TaxID=346182 RepID=A0ABW0SNR7_9GAMM
MPKPSQRPRRAPSLDRLSAFLAVAEAGGFTAAAQRLDINKTVLSQQIARLESELGGALFTRTTRRVELTEAGRLLFDESAPLLQQLESAVAQFGQASTDPSGTLRITAPADYAVNVLGPALAAFQREHPQLQVDLIATHDVLDLVAERIDLAVRFGWLRDSSLRATKLGEFRQLVLASPDYLARAGAPRRPEQLASHAWIALSLLRSPLTWRFEKHGGRQVTVRMRPGLRASSPEGVLGLLRGGAGISVLTDFAATPDLHAGALQQVLRDWSLPSGGIHLVYPATRQPPGKVRRFMDFFRDWLANGAGQ